MATKIQKTIKVSSNKRTPLKTKFPENNKQRESDV